MTRKLKPLLLPLLAMLAVSASPASIASAEETVAGYFSPSVGAAETAKLDGSQIEAATFSIGSLSVTCATATFGGQTVTAGEQSTEAKLEPSYSTCHSVILGVTKLATVTTNGCTFTLNATATFTEGGRGVEYPTDLSSINCPEGKQIEVHVYDAKESEEKVLCTYDVKGQEKLTGITATNKENTPTSANDVVLDFNVANIATTNTKTSAICGTNEKPTVTYKGQSTLRATNSKSEYVDFQTGTPKRFIIRTKPGVATGEKGTAEITTEKGPIKCTNVHYVGTTTDNHNTDLTVTPSYEGCTAFGLTTDINFEGCTFRFTQNPGTFGDGKPGENTAVGQTHTTGPLHIECPEETQIKIEPTEGGKAKCTITIPSQTPGGLVDYKNMKGTKATEDYLLFTNTITGLVYSVEGSDGTCGENKGFLNGALDGAIDVKGFEDKGGTPPATGTQVSLQSGGKLDPK